MRASTAALYALIALALVVLVGLGVWQLQRNEWKQDLVRRVDARTDAPPLEVRRADALSPEEVDYRRVVLDGEWWVDDVQFLANRVRGGRLGEEVIVPVGPVEGGAAVLVNLGWIPEGARAEVVPALSERQGPLAGLARDISRRDARRTPAGSWSDVSPADMGAYLEYSVADWYVIAGEEREPGSPVSGASAGGEALPVQGWERFHNTTPHIEYALTWFGIAAVLVAATVVRFVLPALRARRAAPAR